MKTPALLLGVLLGAMLPAGARADVPHVVAPGETLTSIAATDGLGVAALAAANGISASTELTAGQVLEIPPRGPGEPATTATAASLTVNPRPASTAHAGEPDADADDAATGTGAAAAAPTPAGSASNAPTPSPSTRPQPTGERVSAGQIAAIATRYGVPPALAEAVAWQESGWNNGLVSRLGAVGVMQVVPSTWAWINRHLTPTDLLSPNSAADNVRAGVLLLRSLLAATGGDQRLAVAAYFQGLASVRAHGMYPDTRLYVANVMALERRLGG